MLEASFYCCFSASKQNKYLRMDSPSWFPNQSMHSEKPITAFIEHSWFFLPGNSESYSIMSKLLAIKKTKRPVAFCSQPHRQVYFLSNLPPHSWILALISLLAKSSFSPSSACTDSLGAVETSRSWEETTLNGRKIPPVTLAASSTLL